MRKIGLILCLFLVSAIGTVQANVEYENQAVESAQSWLSLLDDSNYADTWQEAASFFQEAVTQEQWLEAIKATEKLFGKVKSRTVQSKAYLQNLPNAPQGDYVVILYESELENGKHVTETVTPMKDKDGEWRVAGYYINPSH